MNEQNARALDTNVLLRYLTKDSPQQAERARILIDSDRALGISAVVLLETAHALRVYYGHERAVVVDRLVELLQRENILGLGIDKTLTALALLRCRDTTSISVGDALAAACAVSAGVNEMYTFDRTFGRTGMQSIEP